MEILVISTYELGHQPFGIASPAAFLRHEGHSVSTLDLSRQPLDESAARRAALIALYLPMHTATRLAVELLPRLRALNPHAHLCFFGLYAPVNEAFLRSLGAGTILGGEFEEGLVSLARRLSLSAQNGHPPASQSEPLISLSRLHFQIPDRSTLPALPLYAHLTLPDATHRVAGYTEASRGCKHLCRHCPIVPVYNGAFRIVPLDIVLADVRQQVAAGAQHITFGDPDFFNGPAHARAILESFHREFPALTFDATIKVEHLLKHRDLLPLLRDSGCAFVTTAVESLDDAVLHHLDKGHTRADFLQLTKIFREIPLTLHPTFVPFSPWTTLDSYRDLLRTIAEENLISNVAPIQLAIRLLIPAASRLLELPELRAFIRPFDPKRLAYPWLHPDPRLDALARDVLAVAETADRLRLPREESFRRIWTLAFAGESLPAPELSPAAPVATLSEAWYCCAEPTESQLAPVQNPAARRPASESFV